MLRLSMLYDDKMRFVGFLFGFSFFNHCYFIVSLLPHGRLPMSKQKDIDASMRGVVVNWLNDVMQEYKLRREMLYLAVNYMDRFLAQCLTIDRSKLQLVGVCCLLIASKYY